MFFEVIGKGLVALIGLVFAVWLISCLVCSNCGPATSWARSSGGKDPTVCLRMTDQGKDANGVLMTPVQPVDCE